MRLFNRSNGPWLSAYWEEMVIRVVNVSKSMDVYKGQVLEEEEERGGEGARSNDIRVSALFPAWHEENDPLGVRERKLAPLRIVRRETPEDGGSTIKC